MAAKKKKVEIAKEVQEDDNSRIYPDEYIETTNVGIDLVLSNGKGIPKGVNVMFFGLPGNGKTTIFGDMIKRLMVNYSKAGLPFRIHYIDSENSKSLLKSLGVMDYVYDNEEYMPQQVIYHHNINSFDYLEKLYARIMNKSDNWSKDIQLIFIDSVTNLNADEQLEKSVNKGDFGDDARVRKKFYKKWLAPIRDKGITTFWVSQMAKKQNVVNSYTDPSKPAVSSFDLHNMEAVIKVTKSTDSKRVALKKQTVTTIDGVVEQQLRFIAKLDPQQAEFTKNRLGQNFPVELLVNLGKSVINAYTLMNLLIGNKVIKLNGSAVKDGYTVSDDLINYIGAENLDYISDFQKASRKEVNLLCSNNNMKIIQFAKERGIYKVDLGEESEPDDGLF